MPARALSGPGHDVDEPLVDDGVDGRPFSGRDVRGADEERRVPDVGVGTGDVEVAGDDASRVGGELLPTVSVIARGTMRVRRSRILIPVST